MIRKIASILATICILFVGACAAGQIDDVHLARMSGMIGLTEKELIDGWGVPDRQYVMDDRTKIATYTKSTDYAAAEGGFGVSSCIGTASPGIAYGTCLGAPSSTRMRHYFCDLNFKIVRGRIASWSQQGNDCPRIQ